MTKYDIKHQAIAGTLESSDIQIILDKNDGKGIELNLQSSVEYQFGKQIRSVILDTLERLGVSDVKVEAVDKGALDCTIRARTIAVVHRACDITKNYDWEELDSWNV